MNSFFQNHSRRQLPQLDGPHFRRSMLRPLAGFGAFLVAGDLALSVPVVGPILLAGAVFVLLVTLVSRIVQADRARNDELAAGHDSIYQVSEPSNELIRFEGSEAQW